MFGQDGIRDPLAAPMVIQLRSNMSLGLIMEALTQRFGFVREIVMVQDVTKQDCVNCGCNFREKVETMGCREPQQLLHSSVCACVRVCGTRIVWMETSAEDSGNSVTSMATNTSLFPQVSLWVEAAAAATEIFARILVDAEQSMVDELSIRDKQVDSEIDD